MCCLRPGYPAGALVPFPVPTATQVLPTPQACPCNVRGRGQPFCRSWPAMFASTQHSFTAVSLDISIARSSHMHRSRAEKRQMF